MRLIVGALALFWALPGLLWGVAGSPADLVDHPPAPSSLRRGDWSSEAVPQVRRLVFRLQYISGDYGLAVRGRQILDTFEFGEMVQMIRRAEATYRELPAAKPGTLKKLGALRRLIVDRAEWSVVREHSDALQGEILEQYRVDDTPVAVPDLSAGAETYRGTCASCHGEDGGGSEPPGMKPAPTSFRDERMNSLSPYHILNATRFGIDGTAMAAYGDILSDSQLWDLAFFVLTLRENFRAGDSTRTKRPPLAVLAKLSNVELAEYLGAGGEGVTSADVDFHRSHPAAGNGTREPALAPDQTRGNDALTVALQLEDAFVQVAEKIGPSVVGVTTFLPPGADAGGSGSDQSTAAWRVAERRPDFTEGLRAHRSGSGFVVSDDGYILTRHELVEGLPAAGSILAVELSGDRYLQARLVGSEPSIDLAVLKLEDAIKFSPVTIGSSDGVRAGQWAIAVGDPPGVERAFAAGVVSASPIRECYQENLSATRIQTSLQASAGSFGGPLVNIRSEVVGMTLPHGAVAEGRSVVDALPIELAMTVFEALRVVGTQRSPWIGIAVLDLTRTTRRKLSSSPRTGVYIEDVFDPSPAALAGVQVGDVLVRMNGNQMLSVADFQKWLYLVGIGQPLTLELDRGGDLVEVTVTIEERPSSIPTR